MGTLRLTKQLTARLTFLGVLVAGQNAVAADTDDAPVPEEPKSEILDVALGEDGMLIGRVVDAQGRLIVGAPVLVRHKGRSIAAAMTSETGIWQVSGLHGGLHQIVVPQGQTTARFWTAEAAPPTASPDVVTVSTGPVIRGQNSGVAYVEGEPSYLEGDSTPFYGGRLVYTGHGQALWHAPPVNGGFGMLDIFALGSVGATVGALVIAIDNGNDLDKIEDQLANIPQSP